MNEAQVAHGNQLSHSLSWSVMSDSLQPHGFVARQAPLSMGVLQARTLE